MHMISVTGSQIAMCTHKAGAQKRSTRIINGMMM